MWHQWFSSIEFLELLAYRTQLANIFYVLADANPIHISAYSDLGISICFPLNITPDSTDSSPQNDQYYLSTVGKSLMLFGHPSPMTSFNSFITLSSIGLLRSSSCLFAETLIIVVVNSYVHLNYCIVLWVW